MLLFSEVVSKNVGSKVLSLLQFISPVSHNQCLSLDSCPGNLQSHKNSPAESSQDGCCSSFVSEKEKKSTSFCTLTYPVQTALASQGDTDLAYKEQNQLLELLGGVRPVVKLQQYVIII